MLKLLLINLNEKHILRNENKYLLWILQILWILNSRCNSRPACRTSRPNQIFLLRSRRGLQWTHQQKPNLALNTRRFCANGQIANLSFKGFSRCRTYSGAKSESTIILIHFMWLSHLGHWHNQLNVASNLYWQYCNADWAKTEIHRQLTIFRFFFQILGMHTCAWNTKIMENMQKLTVWISQARKRSH